MAEARLLRARSRMSLTQLKDHFGVSRDTLAAWLHDEGRDDGEAANMAKYAAAEAALAALDIAIQCHGGNGVSTEYGLIPLWGLARLLRIAPVSREMILNYVAQHTLGLPRSY